MAKNETGLPNREFLQLAHTYDWEKHDIGGWLWSDKLDGMRCFWDGGITRGLRVEDVPFANVEKVDRYLVQEYATGLWSRYGHPIRAADWWLDALPNVPLDGELYMGPGMFEETLSITRAHNSDSWSRIGYHVFESVNYGAWMEVGCVNNPNFVKVVDSGVVGWVMSRVLRGLESRPLSTQAKILEMFAPENNVIRHVKQTRLMMSQQDAADQVLDIMADVCGRGGEGIIVRNPNAYWCPRRVAGMLKVIPLHNTEATVVGFTTGKDGFRGMLGAVVVRWGDVEFKLSGFKQGLRVLMGDDYGYAHSNPDTRADGLQPAGFKIGDVVTFKYKELSALGVPKSARYWRHRID